jgi:uncharacterized protein YukJ
MERKGHMGNGDTYGVLRGRARAFRPEWKNETPHFQMLVEGAGIPFRVAINTKSNEPGPGNSDLLYVVDENFLHPISEELLLLRPGFTPLHKRNGGAAIDYQRANLFDRATLRRIPAFLPGPNNDLNDELGFHATRSINDPKVEVFIVGNRWGPEKGHPDEVFDFEPGNGMHDIHMNQGNIGRHAHGNGIWQDGAVFFRDAATGLWTAIFLAFQAQAWHTDDHGDPRDTGPRSRTGYEPGPQEPDLAVRIMAAVINPERGEDETVTLLNITPETIDLAGWELADKRNRRQTLRGVIGPGQTRQLDIADGLDIGRDGGALTLYDPDGLKVHGVSWTTREAKRRGWTVTF